MFTFNIPIQGSREEEVFRFSVVPRSVLFAGSRYRQVQQELCAKLIRELHQEGFSFMVGCADGVDRSFRQSLAQNHYKEQTLVACAFARRTHYPYSYGLDAFVVVPPGIPHKAALRRRTLWMVKRCSMVVLFPRESSRPHLGQGLEVSVSLGYVSLKAGLCGLFGPTQKLNPLPDIQVFPAGSGGVEPMATDILCALLDGKCRFGFAT